jgi:hypothetical protein
MGAVPSRDFTWDYFNGRNISSSMGFIPIEDHCKKYNELPNKDPWMVFHMPWIPASSYGKMFYLNTFFYKTVEKFADLEGDLIDTQDGVSLPISSWSEGVYGLCLRNLRGCSRITISFVYSDQVEMRLWTSEILDTSSPVDYRITCVGALKSGVIGADDPELPSEFYMGRSSFGFIPCQRGKLVDEGWYNIGVEHKMVVSFEKVEGENFGFDSLTIGHVGFHEPLRSEVFLDSYTYGRLSCFYVGGERILMSRGHVKIPGQESSSEKMWESYRKAIEESEQAKKRNRWRFLNLNST